MKYITYITMFLLVITIIGSSIFLGKYIINNKINKHNINITSINTITTRTIINGKSTSTIIIQHSYIGN